MDEFDFNIVLLPTSKFSVLALKSEIDTNSLTKSQANNNPCVSSDLDLDDYDSLAYGNDMPLDDTSFQVLLESMNLAPASTTIKVPTINRVKLPFTIHNNGDDDLLIEQDTEVSKMGQGGTGGIIWESSKACTQFIAHHYALLESKLPQLVIEIGSGTGLLGIATATLFHNNKQNRRFGKSDFKSASSGTKFILTDQRNVVPLLERNITRNSGSNKNYNSNHIKAFSVDWNIDNDREKLINEIKSTINEIQREDGLSKSDIEVLVLCSDLVFGNNYKNLINLMEEIHLLFSSPLHTNSKFDDFTEKQSISSGGSFEVGVKCNCELLFCFEEREDRFPSPGFHTRLAQVFDIVSPTPESFPEDFSETFPRIEINWLQLPSERPSCSSNHLN